MQFYVSEYWKDERLNATYFEKYDSFRIPRDWVPDIWVPDTIFENSKGGWIYPLSVPNVVIRIHSFKYLHRFTRYCSFFWLNYKFFFFLFTMRTPIWKIMEIPLWQILIHLFPDYVGEFFWNYFTDLKKKKNVEFF